MRVRRVLLDGASAYEAKCFRADLECMENGRIVPPSDADLLHFYGGAPPPSAVKGLSIPFVAGAAVRRSPLPWRRTPEPALLLRPEDLPEPVEQRYRNSVPAATRRGERATVGFFDDGRPGVRLLAEQAAGRIHRFREDVDWMRFDTPPSPEELGALDLWADPATRNDDRDGFVAEALSSGLLVVASRSPVNEHRLDGGSAGFLVPQSDPNEFAHAILVALFKEELVAERKANIAAAKAKYDPEIRKNALLEAYGTVRR